MPPGHERGGTGAHTHGCGDGRGRGDGAAGLGLLGRVRRGQHGDHVDGAAGRPGRGRRRHGRLGAAGPRLRQQPRRGVDHRRVQRAQPHQGLEPRGLRQPVDRAADRRRHRLPPGRQRPHQRPRPRHRRRSGGRARPTASTSGRSGSPWPTAGSTAWTARPASSPSTSPAGASALGERHHRHRPPPASTSSPWSPTAWCSSARCRSASAGIYKGGDRGVINALDAATGEVRWTFDTVLGDDLWGNPEVNSGGGAWYPPVDRPRARPGLRGASPTRRRSPARPSSPTASSRPGDNLYTDSIVALDLAPASCAWFHQVHAPRPLRPRPGAHPDRPTVEDGTDRGGQRRQGRRAGRPRPRPRRRSCGAPRSGIHENDELHRAVDGPTLVRPAPTAASSRRRPPPTASCTSPPSTPRPPSSSPTRPPTSAPSSAQFDGEVVGGRRHHR